MYSDKQILKDMYTILSFVIQRGKVSGGGSDLDGAPCLLTAIFWLPEVNRTHPNAHFYCTYIDHTSIALYLIVCRYNNNNNKPNRYEENNKVSFTIFAIISFWQQLLPPI